MKIGILFCALCLLLRAGGPNDSPPADVAAPPKTARGDGPGSYSILLAPAASPDHPSFNDCVVIRFTAWQRNGSLYSTSGPNGAPGTQCISALMPALAHILEVMSPGERRRAWLPPQTAPHDSGPDDDGSPPVSLTVDLELIRIRKAPPTPADLRVPSPGAQLLQSGVSMLVIEKGSGTVHVSSKSKLTLTYSAWNQSGVLIESTNLADEPVVLPLALTPPAWREALAVMVAGEQVRLWVPARLIADKPPGDRVYDLKLTRVQ